MPTGALRKSSHFGKDEDDMSTGHSSPAPLPRRGTDAVDRAANGRADESPRGYTAVLGCHPEHAVLVRRHVRLVAELPLEASEVIERLASELFNNAFDHSRSRETGTVRVSVFRYSGGIQVKVTDDGPRSECPTTPQLRALDVDSEHGFGLFLLDSESDCWGVVEEEGGRISVWFEKDRSR